MAGSLKVFLIQYMAILLGVSMIFQQGGFAFHAYSLLTDCPPTTEQFSDILFDGLNDNDTSPDDQLPEGSSESEEENTGKDESKFHETLDLTSQIAFSLATRPGSFPDSCLRSLWLKIPTPPPENPTI